MVKIAARKWDCPPETINDFGRRLTDLRVARNLHVKELADAVGVHANSILLYASGRVDPPLSKVVQLADALGVSVEYLATGNGRRTRAIRRTA